MKDKNAMSNIHPHTFAPTTLDWKHVWSKTYLR